MANSSPPRRAQMEECPEADKIICAILGEGFEDLSDFFEILVALRVAVGVIGHFQSVRIQHHESTRAQGVGALHQLLHPVVEAPAVIEVGQNIVITLLSEFFFFLPVVGNVDDQNDMVGIIIKLFQMDITVCIGSCGSPSVSSTRSVARYFPAYFPAVLQEP